MKRTRVDEDFNPVYPYDTTSTPTVPFINPPFVSSNGLQESPPGILSLNYADPLTITNGKLSVKLGNNVALTNGALSTTTTVNPPITNDNNAIGLNTSPPLTTDANRLTLATQAPLQVSDGRLALNLGNGLATSNQSLTVKTTGAIGFNNQGSLQLSAGGGMRVNGTQLILHVDYPFEAINQLTLRIAQGLEITNEGKLKVKLGTGLTFDSSGNITTSSRASNGRARETPMLSLWSVPFQANCSVYEALDAKLGLRLFKNDHLVFASIYVIGIKGALLNMNDNTLTIRLQFDTAGNLDRGPLDPAFWQNQDSNELAVNALGFMPRKLIYPAGAPLPSSTCSQILPAPKPITFSVTYNDAPTGYSLTFTWSATPGSAFHPPTATFNYISE